jgi:tRNA A-37 threonylcarbamoyl transferase component Bud32
MDVHTWGVIHNDLQPRNVVVSGRKVTLIDFGLADTGHNCEGLESCPELLDMEEVVKDR